MHPVARYHRAGPLDDPLVRASGSAPAQREFGLRLRSRCWGARSQRGRRPLASNPPPGGTEGLTVCLVTPRSRTVSFAGAARTHHRLYGQPVASGRCIALDVKARHRDRGRSIDPPPLQPLPRSTRRVIELTIIAPTIRTLTLFFDTAQLTQKPIARASAVVLHAGVNGILTIGARRDLGMKAILHSAHTGCM